MSNRSPEFRGVMPLPANEKPDLSPYLSARHRMTVVAARMPEQLRPSVDQIASVQFCTEDEFYQMLYQDNIGHGMRAEEAAENAQNSAFQHSGMMFERTGQIGIKQIPRFPGQVLESKRVREQNYFQWLAHELGHSFLPIHEDGTLSEAARLIHVSDEQYREILIRELQKEATLFLHYLEHELQIDIESFLQRFAVQAAKQGVSRVGLLRRELIQNQKQVLQLAGVDATAYQQFAIDQLPHLDFILHGRGVAIVHRELDIHIGEMAHHNSRLVKEVQADTYSMYVAFLEYLDGREVTEEEMVAELKRFQQSEAFRDLIGPEDLTTVDIMETVIAFGSFERFLTITLQNLDVRAEQAYVLSEAEQKALRRLAESSQMAEVIAQLMIQFTQDPEFQVKIAREVIAIADPQMYAQVIKAEKAQRADYSGYFFQQTAQLMQTWDTFKFLAVVVRAAKKLSTEKTAAAASGTRKARDNWSVKQDREDIVIPPMEVAFNEGIARTNGMKPAVILENAAQTLERVSKVKQQKK